jgi:hypothetical protein
MMLSNYTGSADTHTNDIGAYMSVAGSLLIILASLALLTAGLFKRRFDHP